MSNIQRYLISDVLTGRGYMDFGAWKYCYELLQSALLYFDLVVDEL